MISACSSFNMIRVRDILLQLDKSNKKTESEASSLQIIVIYGRKPNNKESYLTSRIIFQNIRNKAFKILANKLFLLITEGDYGGVTLFSCNHMHRPFSSRVFFSFFFVE